MKSDSIAFRLRLAFIVSAALQCIVMLVVLVSGGVIQQSKSNSYQIFSEKVEARSFRLENAMRNIWTDFEHYTVSIRQYFTDERMSNGLPGKGMDQILEDMAPVVLDAMYYTKTTGAFLILDEMENGGHGALYFKNANPDRSDEKNSSVYMLAGPWSVAEKMDIVTDPEWRYRLTLDDSNRDFYEKPYSSLDLTKDTSLLGYWSRPFKVTPGGDEVITYSVPLTDKKGRPIGVFGVEVSVSHLYKYMPSSELKAQDSLGYMIGTNFGDDGQMKATVVHGARQKRLVEEGQNFELEPVDERNYIYRFLGADGRESAYASVRKMGMYYNNTPFADENWYLIGLIEKPALLEHTRQIGMILGVSFIISLCLGCVISVIISRWFSKSSKLMELSEVPIGVFELREHSNRVFMTMQCPRLLQLTREQERRFTKDKKAFECFLDSLSRHSVDEDGIIHLCAGGQETWLRLTHKVRDGAMVGVLEDVTDEVLQKQMLTNQRDFDGLTGVKNRMAFEREAGHVLETLPQDTPLCAIMCDLNGLKQANDQFGHLAGDTYIKFAANAIQKAFPEGVVYRIGGDEFAVVLKGVPQERLERCIRKLGREMERFNREAAYCAGVAVGYSYFVPGNEDGFWEVLARADEAMYEEKRRMYGVKE